MKIKTEEFVKTAKKELENTQSRAFLRFFPPALASMRDIAMESFQDPEAALAYGRSIREEVVARLPDLLEEFEKNAKANGAKVFWARSSKEANEYILNLAQKNKVQYVTKGKSMVTEETGLNEILIENGIEVFETDLGEFIAQLLNRPPFHILGPAINIPVEEIRDIFMEKAGLEDPTTDPIQLGLAARRFLRNKFHKMKMGITGVNFAVADTGTIINVENEGNIRFNKSSPRIQISIMSLEKVIPTMQDAMHLLRLLCRNATGQALGAYVTLDSGPKKKDEVDGPDELHIIILDNGRSKIYKDPIVREALRCIRCAGCLNDCPIYQKIGGYPYGWAYSGPMGQVLSPLLLGLDRTQDLIRSCTLCHACKVVCPAGIDHPGILLHYRARNVEKDPLLGGSGAPVPDTLLYKAYAFSGVHPRLWRIAAKMFRPYLTRMKRLAKRKQIKGPLSGWFQIRDLPDLPRKTFHDRWEDIK